MAPKTRQQASALVDQLTRTTVTALTQSAGQGLKQDLGPALRSVLEEDLGPGLAHLVRADLAPALREAVRDELVPVVGIVSREASRQLVLGAADALEELQVKRDLGQLEESLWSRLDHTLHKGIQISQVIAWVLGLALAIVIGLVVRATVLRRRIEADRARSERLLLSLVDELHRGCDKPDVEELLSQIRTRVPDLDDRGYMAELARRAERPRLHGDGHGEFSDIARNAPRRLDDVAAERMQPVDRQPERGTDDADGRERERRARRRRHLARLHQARAYDGIERSKQLGVAQLLANQRELRLVAAQLRARLLDLL